LSTLDELFEALTLIQTAKIKNFPIVIMGTDYWKGLIDFNGAPRNDRGCRPKRDLLDRFRRRSHRPHPNHAIEPFGLKRIARARRSFPWLGERGLCD